MSNCRVFWSYHGEQNGTHRAGVLGPGLGALVGLVLGLGWAGFVVWPEVIGVLQIRKRFDVRLWRSSSPEAGRRRECGAIP